MSPHDVTACCDHPAEGHHVHPATAHLVATNRPLLFRCWCGCVVDRWWNPASAPVVVGQAAFDFAAPSSRPVVDVAPGVHTKVETG